MCTQAICLELYINWLSAVFEAGEDRISGHVRQLIYHDVKIDRQKKVLAASLWGADFLFFLMLYTCKSHSVTSSFLYCKFQFTDHCSFSLRSASCNVWIMLKCNNYCCLCAPSRLDQVSDKPNWDTCKTPLKCWQTSIAMKLRNTSYLIVPSLKRCLCCRWAANPRTTRD